MKVMKDLRIGYGEDAHALTSGRPLIVGNVVIDSPLGAVAHSDGDVLLHALADAVLSAFALGDIGSYFPPTDPRYKDMNSAELLEHVLKEAQAQSGGQRLVNVALVVTLGAPKLTPYRQAIQARVTALLGLPPGRVGLSFKTSEGLAPNHIQARATVLFARSSEAGLEG
jgi:2-C-methyl-D-erythritol 2,4-cyclodiphosphate synthase